MTNLIARSATSLIAAGAVLLLLTAAPAWAAAGKVWVAYFGADSGTCGAATSPCASFAQAVSNVAAGGEIGVLTSGDYGEVQISKSVHITNDGAGEASVHASAGGFSVNVLAGVGDVVSLRGLVIDGAGIGAVGIRMVGGQTGHIQNCVIRNFEASGAYGLAFDGTSGSVAQLFVSDSIVFNNGSTAESGGILIVPGNAATASNAVLDRVHLENNVIGLSVKSLAASGSGAHVIVRDSVISGNAGAGISAVTEGLPTFLVVEHTSVVNNGGTGILANGPHATMLLDGNVVSRNGVGLSAVDGGQLISYGNNRNNNNLGADGAPTGFYSPM